MASKQKQFKLTLMKSLAGRAQKHKDTIQCLGLRKIRQSVVVDNKPTVCGMINKVSYLLHIEEI
jgi:large subunit ribosomal protein L30